MARILAMLPVLLALSACGEDGGPATFDAAPADAGADSGIDPDGCRVLTLGPPQLQVNLFQQVTGVRYPVVGPSLEGAPADFLFVELYDSFTGGLPPLVPGTFDLAAAPNDALTTCQHCVWLLVDDQPLGGALDPIYFQAEGTLTLSQVTDPLEPIFIGGTSRVVLRRAEITAEGQFQFAAEADCVSVTGLDVDTTPTPGRACLSAEDCGNPFHEICDPQALVCAGFQCGEQTACAADELCMGQYPYVYAGACYIMCDPTAASPGCPAAQQCVQLGPDPTWGVCEHRGDAALGAACEVEDTSTSCAGDAVCSAETSTCTPTCGFFAAEPGCPTGALCSLFGVCEPPSAGSDAAIGSLCEAEAELASGCGADGQVFRGICFSYDAQLVCEKACLSKMAPFIPEDLGCGESQFCALRFTSGLGICRPLPVCGDGELGEIDEICDDGNTLSGDGCSGDCQTVEYDVICAAPPALPLDGSLVSGDTTTGWDGFFSTCQAGLARAELYTVTPPGAGRLRVSLTSATSQVISIRADCAVPGTELGCAWPAGPGETQELILQLTEASPAPVTVMVTASTLLDEGPFTVSAEFVAQSCGDGIVAGSEICDDGNPLSGDGCRGDCLEVEYDVYCATAPLLSTSSPQAGDTTGAINLFDAFCSGEGSEGLGPDRLYRYVAPAAGTLHLSLDQGLNNLALIVYDGCGAPADVTLLACSAVYEPEEADVTVAAGQTITVVVEGFPWGGAYTLEAAFTAM